MLCDYWYLCVNLFANDFREQASRSPFATIIYYKHVDEQEIAPGDVITYDLNGTLVTHRVKEIVNGQYRTQGDANNIEDQQLVPYSSVQGKVGGLAIPILGFGVQFINEHIWMFAIFIGILVAEFLLSNIKSDKISVSEKGREHEGKGII